ncbi:hypothetical protein L1887_59331 [Cichorium endivia]|nr:hypothetical protein L1887_59331 [Cichorium endivia]
MRRDCWLAAQGGTDVAAAQTGLSIPEEGSYLAVGQQEVFAYRAIGGVAHDAFSAPSPSRCSLPRPNSSTFSISSLKTHLIVQLVVIIQLVFVAIQARSDSWNAARRNGLAFGLNIWHCQFKKLKVEWTNERPDQRKIPKTLHDDFCRVVLWSGVARLDAAGLVWKT